MRPSQDPGSRSAAPDQIRRSSKRDFFIGQSAIFDLDISWFAKFTYLFLCRCADGEGQAFPSYTTIGKRCSFSRRTALRAIEELREIGLLSVEHRATTREGAIFNTSNLYLLHDPSTAQVCARQSIVNSGHQGGEGDRPKAAENGDGDGSDLPQGLVPDGHRGGDSQSLVPNSHQGSDSQSLGWCQTVTRVVTHSHQGSDSQSPITISIEQDPLNNHGENARDEQINEVAVKKGLDENRVTGRGLDSDKRAETREQPVVPRKGFDEFWMAYPKRTGKPYAQAEWNRISPDSELQKRIMACLAKDNDSRQWLADDGRYIPKPENWLSQRRWEQQQDLTQEMIDAKYTSEWDFRGEEPPPKEVSPEALLEGFEAFWAEYPNKVDREEALTAWTKLRPGKELRSKMMIILAKHKTTSRWQYAGGAYIARPSVWIDQRLWDNPRFLE